ncbi:MAG TPA: cohesin domain-containing protein [Myxococcota bacterium]|jgi:hypothetical protein|nr:cohesin domain-containing protein [Myxococcota bacterium]
MSDWTRALITAVVGSIVGLAGNAQALNEITLTAEVSEVSEVEVGNQIDLLLEMDFLEATTGGGIRVAYDPTVLEFVSFTFDPQLHDPHQAFHATGPDDNSAAIPDPQIGPHQEVAFGWMVFDPPYGADGSRSIGTFTFNALQEGQTALAIWESEATSWGPFSSISGTLDVQYGAAALAITGAAVPSLGPLATAVLGTLLLALGTRRLIA